VVGCLWYLVSSIYQDAEEELRRVKRRLDR
jgi:hypothetical protein